MRKTAKDLINIDHLTRGYPKSTSTIFDKLDFHIAKHDFYFVVGESGVGKTTLVKFLIRQLTPPTKMIFHKKEDIARFGRAEVQAYRRNIGVVFQDFKLIERKNVSDNIAYPLEIEGIPRAEREKKVEKILSLLGMSEKRHIKIPLLSGGEKQRVAIGRALINNPEFIIADEPTGNLDRTSSRNIADILIDLNKQGNTIVLITHDQQLIDYISDQHTTKSITLSP